MTFVVVTFVVFLGVFVLVSVCVSAHHVYVVEALLEEAEAEALVKTAHLRAMEGP